MIELQSVTKRHVVGDVETLALNDVSLHIEAGEYVAITGPSGCGKTTLLSLLGLLDRPSSGRVLLQGEDMGTRSEAQLAGLLFEQGFAAHGFGHVGDLQQAAALAVDFQRSDVDGLQHALAVIAVGLEQRQRFGVQGVGEARRPAEIEGFADHQGETRVDVGAEGFAQRQADRLPGQLAAAHRDPVVPQADAAAVVDDDEADINAVGEGAVALHRFSGVVGLGRLNT